MGKIADDMADIIVLTDDDTYTEDSTKIIDMIRPGISRNEGDSYYVLPDRKEAIHKALEIAGSGDIVLIAGKGSENVQITNNGAIEWSDKGVIEEWLNIQ